MPSKPNKQNTPTREKKIAAKIAQNKLNILEAHKTHGINVSKVCKAVGLSRYTYYDYRKKDSEFETACIEACESICDEAEDTVLYLMRNSRQDKVKLDAAKSVLNAKAKDRGWGVERREQKHSGDLNVNSKSYVVRLPDNGRRSYSIRTTTGTTN